MFIDCCSYSKLRTSYWNNDCISYFTCTKKCRADLKMIKMSPVYLRNYGKNIQVGNESLSTYTWEKLFHLFVRACHHHHGQVKEKLVFPYFLPLLLFWYNLVTVWWFHNLCVDVCLFSSVVPAVGTGYM